MICCLELVPGTMLILRSTWGNGKYVLGQVYPNVTESDVNVCINRGTPTCLTLCLCVREKNCQSKKVSFPCYSNVSAIK